MARTEGTIRIGGGALALELEPADGGKVTGLRCERHGREWLHAPPAHAEAGNADEFGASRSWGWDELFPTVLATSAAPAPWPAPLRDHGELWGRPWTIESVDRRSAVLRFDDPGGRYRFTRAIAVRDEHVVVRYELRNLGSHPLPWMWAMHPILAIEPADLLELLGGERPAPAIAPPDGVTVLKLYAGPSPRPTARLVGRQCRLEIATADVGYLGLYVNRGGWPAPGSGLHQIGLEPTTSPVDDLAAAVAGGTQRTSLPGEQARWTVAIRVDG